MNLQSTTYADYWQSRPYDDLGSVLCMRIPVWLQEVVQPLFREAMVRRLGELVAPDRPLTRVLDLACGPGDWTIAYRRLAHETWGVDINPHFIDQARRAVVRHDIPGVRFSTANLMRWRDFEDAPLVALGACLQYLTDDEVHTLLGRIAAAQRPGNHVYARSTVMCGWRRRYGTEQGIYRRRGWYEAAFARHGYRLREAIWTSSMVPAWACHRALGHRSFGAARALAATVTTPLHLVRSVQRRNDFLSWVLVRRG